MFSISEDRIGHGFQHFGKCVEIRTDDRQPCCDILQCNLLEFVDEQPEFTKYRKTGYLCDWWWYFKLVNKTNNTGEQGEIRQINRQPIDIDSLQYWEWYQ